MDNERPAGGRALGTEKQQRQRVRQAEKKLGWSGRCVWGKIRRCVTGEGKRGEEKERLIELIYWIVGTPMGIYVAK